MLCYNRTLLGFVNLSNQHPNARARKNWMRGSTLSGRVALLFKEAALEGEIGLLGHRWLELCEDLLGGRGVPVQQVDRGHRQQLGRGQIAVPWLVDPPIGT